MSCRYLSSFLVAGLFTTAAALADGHTACAKCHDADEFASMSAASIEADLRDTGIPPHKQFAELSDAQVQAIAAELSGAQ